MKRTCFLFAFFFVVTLGAQNDSTLLLKPERLSEKDIAPRDLGLNRPMAISATRSPEALDNLPYTVWVITAADIANNGFVTLGDVLRAAPGIRVSQPGNALEGETFLMRGLTGNEYVKILINDVPIRPGIAVGMPIGAQLPIRQAERIEVFYGPSGALYGNEACAGVVNIILKETERPVFTQADLGFGKNGYNSLDLMFGGKLGKDKKIFRYSLYGSSTIRESTDLYYDNNYLFNLNNYLPFGLDSSVYRFNPNYKADEKGESLSKTAPIPHESRLFGLNFTWRGIHFTYNRMARLEHSALGLSPLAVSWSNPSNRLNERMESFTLGFNRNRPRWTSYNNLSFLRYQISPTSTTSYIFDQVSAANYNALKPLITNDIYRQILVNNLSALYGGGERYGAASGFNVQFESRIDAILKANLHFGTGIQVNVGGGSPYNGHYNEPIELKILGNTNDHSIQPFSPYLTGNGDITVLTQIEWRGKKLGVVGGLSGNVSTLVLKPLAMPRIALIYHIDSLWSVYGNYSTGFRYPSLYAQANSYNYLANNLFSTFGNIGGSDKWLKKPELTQAYEAGLRYVTQGFSARIVYFNQTVSNQIRTGYFVMEHSELNGDTIYYYGYNNGPGKSMSIWGLQGLFSLGGNEKSGLNYRYGSKTSKIYSHTEVYMQYTRGHEWYLDGAAPTSEVLNMPRWMVQFRSSWHSGKLFLMVSSNHQTQALSKAVLYKDQYQRTTFKERYPSFRTWDFVTRVYLSNHFLVYFQMQNLFNRHYAGLDATGTPDDLIYNPQQGRTWRLGVNYSMN